MRSANRQKQNTGNAISGQLFAEERQRSVLDLLRKSGKVTVEELTRSFRVSPPTIRADLSRLESQGLLRRTHGGAIALENTLYEPPYAERAVLRHAEKRSIAIAAARLVQEGDTVLIDAGTTCHEIALVLKEFRRLTVVTNSIASAEALAENDGIETILIGGIIQPRRRAVLGALATQFLGQIQCDHAFVAMSGVHLEAGFTVVDFDAAQLKRRMLEKAKLAAAVADSSKIGQIAFACVGPLGSANVLITDYGISTEARQAYESTGLEVIVGPPA
jgi:DeoR family transcriptional regulator, fructose operon transcriptional repressor